MELIGLIHEELLKSAELTGIWERKLRQIEKKEYEAKTFLDELKQMVCDIVYAVLADNSNRRVALTLEEKKKPAEKKTAEKTTRKKAASKSKKKEAAPLATVKEGDVCPLCGKGHIIKGKTAFGCSEWKNGCTFRQSFE